MRKLLKCVNFKIDKTAKKLTLEAKRLIAALVSSFWYKKLIEHMESNELLRPEQYGFRKNPSCEIALNSIHDRWLEWLDGESNVVAIY
jgi:hypothetical protein